MAGRSCWLLFASFESVKFLPHWSFIGQQFCILFEVMVRISRGRTIILFQPLCCVENCRICTGFARRATFIIWFGVQCRCNVANCWRCRCLHRFCRFGGICWHPCGIMSNFQIPKNSQFTTYLITVTACCQVANLVPSKIYCIHENSFLVVSI